MRARTDNPSAAKYLTALVAALLAWTLVAAAPALAQDEPPDPTGPTGEGPLPPTCFGSGGHDDAGGGVIGECFGNSPGAGPSITVSSQMVWNWYQCNQWREYSVGSRVAAVTFHDDLDIDAIIGYGLDPTATYAWYHITCEWHSGEFDDAGNPIVETWGWGFQVIETSPPVDPLVLRQRAEDRIDPDPPTPATAPMWDAFPAAVNLPTWLWLEDDWEPQEESETEGFVTVVVQARPVEVTWELGDGVVVCETGGVAWAPGMADSLSDCLYTFENSSAGQAGEAYEASATVRWVFHWWLNGVSLGDYDEFTLTTPFAIAVAEIQAIETGGN